MAGPGGTIEAEGVRTLLPSRLADGQGMERKSSRWSHGMAFSVIAIAAGAVMYWAVTAQGHGFRLTTVGSSS